MDWKEQVPRAHLYSIGADGTSDIKLSGITCSNGTGWSSDDKIMLVSSSYSHKLQTWSICFKKVLHRFSYRPDIKVRLRLENGQRFESSSVCNQHIWGRRNLWWDVFRRRRLFMGSSLAKFVPISSMSCAMFEPYRLLLPLRKATGWSNILLTARLI